ncbi:hypothetical protein GCM10022420_013490 [Streptomyces iranensis]
MDAQWHVRGHVESVQCLAEQVRHHHHDRLFLRLEDAFLGEAQAAHTYRVSAGSQWEERPGTLTVVPGVGVGGEQLGAVREEQRVPAELHTGP